MTEERREGALAAAADRFTIWLLGAICVVGLASAFVGLTVSSFWADELFSAWVVGDDGLFRSAVARMLSDEIPPLFYFVLFSAGKVFGFSDLVFRASMAVLAVSAVIVFVFSLKPWLGLRGRLFGAAVAVVSPFWFFQSQNVRPYALVMLLGAVLLYLALRAVDAARRGAGAGAPLAAMFLVMAIGSFVHVYFFFLSLAVLCVLFVLLVRERIRLAGFFVILFVAVAGYVFLVIHRFGQLSMSDNWIPNTPKWYASQVARAISGTADWPALAALLLVGCAAIWFGRNAIAQAAGTSDSVGGPHPGEAGLERLAARLDPVLALCLGAPLILLFGALFSSLAMTPTLTDRNLLVCSPFVWGLSAWLYERVAGSRPRAARSAVLLVGAVLVGLGAAVFGGRLLPRTEPFREAAMWIRSQPGCEGQTILVVTSDDKKWAAPGYMEGVIAAQTGRYLQPFARTQTAYLEDVTAGRLPIDIKPQLQRRIDGDKCPVLAWWPRRTSADRLDAIRAAIAKDAERAASAPRIEVRGFSAYGGGLRPRLTEPQAYVFYVGQRG